MTEDEPSSSSGEEGLSDDDAKYPDTVKTSAKLRDFLSARVVDGMFDKVPQEFVPEGVVQGHMKFRRVKIALGIKIPNEEEEELINFIVDKAPKAFAVTVVAKINANRAMRWLKQNGFTDDNLPVPAKTDVWQQSWQAEFYKAQWMFFATVFSTVNYGHNLQEAHIIPFVEKISDVGHGAFGIVSQYAVHKAHMDPKPEPSHLRVAVKEVKTTGDPQEVAVHWEREVAALRRMNALKNDNIVRFITAFRRHTRNGGVEHYLMFEWADSGNLRNLWERIPKPRLTASLAKQVVQQIFGLANALNAAHNLNNTGASYRHGDLKPENILVFKDETDIGTLKIGDWGEAKYQGQRTEMRLSGSKSRIGTVRYEAPEIRTGIAEAYEGQSKDRKSRMIDIWALGCITLEFIVWLLHGLEGLERFNTEVSGPSFYQITVENGETVAKVHPNAVRWMDRMARLPACNGSQTAIGRLLELVKTSLLVVKLPRRLGTNLAFLDPNRTAPRSRSDSFFPNEAERSNHSQSLTVIHASPAANQPRRPNSVIEVTADSSSVDIAPGVPTIRVLAGGPEVKVMSDVPAIRISPVTTTLEFRTANVEPRPAKLVPKQRKPERKGDARGLSQEICQILEDILTEDDSVGYWPTEQLYQLSPALVVTPGSVTPSSDTGAELNAIELHTAIEENIVSVLDDSRLNYDPPVLDPNDWKLQWDNTAGSELLGKLKKKSPSDFPVNHENSTLCEVCGKYSRDLLSPGFAEPYEVDALEKRANTVDCALCKLLWMTCLRNGGEKMHSVQFNRLGPSLHLDNSSRAVLSVVRPLGTDALAGIESQVGFAELPKPGGPTHLGLVRQWLDDCDHKHGKCKRSTRTGDDTVRLPTRLVDVGGANDSIVKIWETTLEDSGDWIALSHRWGEKKHHFSTTRANLQEHLRGINIERLPATFRDAVLVTRALGRRYLWIDSLCVIQGEDGDFKSEAKRMEDVYSGAYCVIAASRASNHADGFLKAREHRDYVGIIPEGRSKTPVYICQNIDNFKQHVLEGPLNRRGWVLQEHALARRTVFFTEYQMYFECSDGIRCETGTKMNNNVAALLGDSNFPKTLYKSTRGGKILQYQGLYEQYSRLGLTNPEDRPIAIQGLQQRLLDTMEVRGGFGILDEGDMRGLLRRSLLWCRGPDSLTPKLSRITFPPDSVPVPSWSWMAYTGGKNYPGAIDYLDLEFDTWDWEDLQSPWSQPKEDEATSDTASPSNPTTASDETMLVATARDIDLDAAYEEDGDLRLDDPDTELSDATLCVVLGKAKGSTSLEEQKNCVLIIAPSGKLDGNGKRLYERKGTGFLPGKCISPSGFEVCIH